MRPCFHFSRGRGDFVGRNVQIRNCAVNSGYNVVEGNITIGGNFACDNNSAGCFAMFGSVRGNVELNNNSGVGGPVVEVVGNNVGGNVQVNNNSGSLGNNTVVESNTIGGNLRCARNTPGVSGGGNTVTGNKQGQCAGL